MASITPTPSMIKAITIDGHKAKVSKIQLQTERPTYVLVKVEAVALNPTDWKQIANAQAGKDSISGCDFAGTVFEAGEEVEKTLQAGDRVAGCTHGGNLLETEDGCFAEYAVAKGDLLVKIPDSLSFEAAATFPLGVSTVGQGLFQKALKLDLPTNPTTGNEPVLIYGGSTATGSLGIQFAKLAGYRVLTTCSPHNYEFVKALGADAVYDYRDPECGKKINRDTNDSLKFVWDTISLEASAAICAAAISSNGSDARYGSILPVQLPRKDVTATATLMYTIFDEPVLKGDYKIKRSTEDFDFAKNFFAITEQLLAEGKLQTHPATVKPRGLEGVLEGLLDLKADKVSGRKLVYRIEDTPESTEAEITL